MAFDAFFFNTQHYKIRSYSKGASNTAANFSLLIYIYIYRGGREREREREEKGKEVIYFFPKKQQSVTVR